jgi:malonyl-CoA O-methyltransferase
MEFMHVIDKRRVRGAFGKQAAEYDSHAFVQQRVITRFLDKLRNEELASGNYLDIGAGSGMLLRALRSLYRDGFGVGIDLSVGMSILADDVLKPDQRTKVLTADAEHLPFAAAAFDLVVSTSTFQWLTDLGSAFEEAFRVLKPGGIFSFALFGEQTLHELRSSYRRALSSIGQGESDHTHKFFCLQDVGAALEKSGFIACRAVSELDTEMHDDVSDLLRSLKRIGAGNASPRAPRGLSGKMVMLEMMARYRLEFGRESGVPATYEIIYGMGEKPLSTY